jgi:hypothetical protein
MACRAKRWDDVATAACVTATTRRRDVRQCGRAAAAAAAVGLGAPRREPREQLGRATVPSQRI